jgi:ketosteroid isomerase-like protein
MHLDLLTRLRHVADELDSLANDTPVTTGADIAERNRHVVSAFLDALEHGDLDRLDDLVHSTVRYDIPGRSRISGVYEGLDGVKAACAIAPRAGVRDLVSTRTDLLAGLQRVASFHEIAGTLDGRTIRFEVALRFEIADGRIASIVEYSSDQHTADDVFGSSYHGR